MLRLCLSSLSFIDGSSYVTLSPCPSRSSIGHPNPEQDEGALGACSFSQVSLN